MRILQVVPNLRIGGVERNTIQSAIIMKKNKIVPFVISYGGKMVSELEEESIQHIRLWVHTKNPFIILVNAFIIAIIIFLKNINIVHVRSRAPAWSCWLACININNFKNINKNRIEKLKKKYNILNQYIVSLPGRLTWWKGQKVFLESIKYIDNTNIKYLLIGNGNEKYYNELNDIIIKFNLPVIIDTDCNDIPAMYQLSDIIISASTECETFGRVSVEAMASEKIVIATNIGGSTETIVNQKSGYLIPPNNPKILAKYIIDVKNKKLTLKGGDILKQAGKYSLERFEKNIISFYKSLY